MSINIVILAAGKGTRMKSSLPKVLHTIANKPLLQHVIDSTKQLNPSTIHIVYGHGGEQLQQRIHGSNLHWVEQQKQLGTGHALQQVLPHLNNLPTLVLLGDVPLISVLTLQKLISTHQQAALTLLTATLSSGEGYGRIIRDSQQHMVAIREQKDATEYEKQINEINTGIMLFSSEALRQFLPQLNNNNQQQEYYLTDMVSFIHQHQLPMNTVTTTSLAEVTGVNNRVQLAQLERVYQQQQAEQLMLQGVTLLDPQRIDIRGELFCDQDVRIDINCVFEGTVTLGKNVTISANCLLKDCHIGDDSVIHANSIIEQSTVAEKCQIGPFARVRPGTVLKAEAKLGNFVEIKKSIVGQGAKVNHLSYIGDAELGNKVNIGAGTITCNYDGVNKYRTTIADGAFIGSNTALVAPVTIGKQATIGAGSVIVKNVAEAQLAVGRGKQRNIDHWQRQDK